MNGKKDILSGSVVAVLDGIYLYLCGGIEPFRGKGTTPLTNQFIPYFWGSALMLLSVLLILRGVRQVRKQGKKSAEGPREKRSAAAVCMGWISDNREVIASFACLFLYILLLKKIGFVIMTALFLTVETLILTPREKRNYLLSVLLGIGMSAALYFIFGKTLHILLPVGIFSF